MPVWNVGFFCAYGHIKGTQILQPQQASLGGVAIAACRCYGVQVDLTFAERIIITNSALCSHYQPPSIGHWALPHHGHATTILLDTPSPSLRHGGVGPSPRHLLTDMTVANHHSLCIAPLGSSTSWLPHQQRHFSTLLRSPLPGCRRSLIRRSLTEG